MGHCPGWVRAGWQGLARRMRVGRGMVTSLVSELLADGSIYEGTTVDAPRGRKPMMLHIRTKDRLVVAIDVRFSRTYLMLTDFSGARLAMETFETVVDPPALVGFGKSPEPNGLYAISAASWRSHHGSTACSMARSSRW